MNDDDINLLVARRDRALARMSTISEAPGSRPLNRERMQAPSGGGSKPPPGVNFDRIRSVKECPDKDRSLRDFWAWQFAHAKHLDDLPVLCALAERDLESRAHTGMSTAERHRARNRSILASRYYDQPPEVVAAFEDCTEKHVRVRRRANGMNPKTGRPER